MASKTYWEIEPPPIERKKRTQWNEGKLHRKWAREFPSLFDDDDLATVNKRYMKGRLFFEWHAAILLHQATGYSCLVTKYEFQTNQRKTEEVEKILPVPVLDVCHDKERFGGTHGPDLLLYQPDYTDWFFCEVKGPTDKLNDRQKEKFSALAKVSNKPIWLMSLRYAKPE